MSELRVPESGLVLDDFIKIKEFLDSCNVFFDKWETDVVFKNDTISDTILKAYDKPLKSFMAKGGYLTADVISVNKKTKKIEEISNKFIREHTHTDDEVRFIVEGSGTFWFNLGPDKPVFSLFCDSGALISVPANAKHWFDMGNNPFVKAIRIFKDKKGWVANYTNSGIESSYINK